ncbi:transcriptional regulator, GntR family [Desulfuromusa kysingii]|uniref:Transcriptional regulator, GntR family n=1 Tax=Desulfuromusa kysingii TaxID=37625 RepID=A0A1H4ARG1_9BACT|nr:GntR family transcriptional regulator [Desulfuromusa kysingii]SEA38469.1 transcriptional regulator, GntR family [Desulfuromusa kysingii]
MKTKLIERHQTLREKILETIRDAILKGDLKPGEKVAEPELAERFGISRTPIREAFRQLESEGYLTVVPRKGAVVAALSEKDVQEYYAVKSILEGYAAELAAENLSEKELAKLISINERLKRLATEGDVKTFYKVHHEFHDTFLKAADNSKLYELINQLGQKFTRLRMASLSVEGRMAISVAEHDKLLKAFHDHDGKAAENLIKKTAAIGGKVLLENMAHSQGEPVTDSLLDQNIDAY